MHPRARTGSSVISTAARTAGALTETVRSANASSRAAAAAPRTTAATGRAVRAAFASRAEPRPPRCGRRSKPHDQLSSTETPASASHFTSSCPMFSPQQAQCESLAIAHHTEITAVAPTSFSKTCQSFLAAGENYRHVHRRLAGCISSTCGRVSAQGNPARPGVHRPERRNGSERSLTRACPGLTLPPEASRRWTCLRRGPE